MACAITLSALTASVQAAVDDFPYWHTLSAEQLQVIRSNRSKVTPALETAFARALGYQQIQRGIEQLRQISDLVETPQDKAYWRASNCVLHVQNGDLDAARDYCEQLQATLQEESLSSQFHPSVLAVGYYSLAAYVIRNGQSQQALDLLDTALECAVKANDRSMLAILHHNKALPFVGLGMPDMAVSSLETARRYQDAIPPDSQLPSILLHNLAYVQAQRGAHESAIEEFNKVIDWAIELDQLPRGYIAVTQLSHSLTALNRPDEAIATLLPWIERSDFAKSADTHADALRALGQAYLAAGDTGKAEVVLARGLEVAQTQGNPLRIAQLGLAWGNLLLQTERYEEAVSQLSTLLEQTDVQSQMRADVLGQMAQAQQRLGNHASAYRHLVEHMAVDAATRTEDFDRRLTALRAANDLDQVNYELAVVRERERVAQERSEQDRINRNIVIIATLLVGVIGFLIFRRVLERREARAQTELNERLQQTIEERTREIEAEMSLRIAAEKARAELEKRVAEDERLRTIGQLTGGVAHDFNNLLTVILLSADLLKSDQADDVKGLLEDIIHAGESGRATTQSLLAYARQQELQPEAIDLQHFLRQRASLFRRTLGGAIDLQVTADQPAMVVADPGQLTTCLINLLFNAREAMGDSGQVEILLDTSEPSQVALVISDTGPGMSPGVLARATEPFFSTKFDGGGSGLGLSMVYGFMKQSGGELSICSKQDPHHSPVGEFGTSVTLTFSSEQAPSVANVATVEFGQVERSGRTALLIEDQAAVRDVCRTSLKRLGFDVVEAETGVEAMDIILEGRTLDLVVTDALMPGGVSGLDVVAALRSLYDDLPVVLMSGGPVEPPDNCVFLMKPFSLAELDATVRRIVQEAPVIEIGSKT